MYGDTDVISVPHLSLDQVVLTCMVISAVRALQPYLLPFANETVPFNSWIRNLWCVGSALILQERTISDWKDISLNSIVKKMQKCVRLFLKRQLKFALYIMNICLVNIMNTLVYHCHTCRENSFGYNTLNHKTEKNRLSEFRLHLCKLVCHTNLQLLIQ